MTDYRYTLWRGPWMHGTGTVLFVMLNPSTADEHVDDPTVRRCIGFAQSWGFQWMLVGNLYAARATDPRELLASADPVGPDNDRALEHMAARADEVIVAWGAATHPDVSRPGQVLQLLRRHPPLPRCLGQTKDLQPRHPLYVPADTARQPFVPGMISAPN